MEFNRNQYFMIGLVLLFIGIELRVVDSFVLNERSSRRINSSTRRIAGWGHVAPEPHAATARMIRVGAATCAPQAFR